MPSNVLRAHSSLAATRSLRVGPATIAPIFQAADGSVGVSFATHAAEVHVIVAPDGRIEVSDGECAEYIRIPHGANRREVVAQLEREEAERSWIVPTGTRVRFVRKAVRA
jgi:hypothetical protein